MPRYDTTELLNTIKTKALVPSNQSTFTSVQILKIADEELQTGIVPMIMGAREEYFVKYVDVSFVQNQSEYEIPERAIGSKLRTVTIVSGTSEYKIPLFIADQVPDRNDPYGFNAGTIAYLRGNKVVIDPSSNISGDLRLYYFNRRNTLIEQSDAGRIDAINTATNQVTLGNIPTTFTTSETYDFVKATPGFENLGEDFTATGISGLVVTFSSLPSNLSIGDYLCLSGESPIVQLPVEFHAILAQRVILRILEALGDTNGVQIAQNKLLELEKNAMTLISPRVDGNPKKVINPYGPLNGGGRWRKWWNG